MVVKKCERCGNDIIIEKSKEVPEIKCTHCNREYELTSKTKWVAMAIVLFIIFVLAFLTTLTAQILEISPYILMIPLIAVSLFLNKFVLFIMAKFNNVSYQQIKE